MRTTVTITRSNIVDGLKEVAERQGKTYSQLCQTILEEGLRKRVAYSLTVTPAGEGAEPITYTNYLTMEELLSDVDKFTPLMESGSILEFVAKNGDKAVAYGAPL